MKTGIDRAVELVAQYSQRTGEGIALSVHKKAGEIGNLLSAGEKQRLLEEGLAARVGENLRNGNVFVIVPVPTPTTASSGGASRTKKFTINVTPSPAKKFAPEMIVFRIHYGTETGGEKPLAKFTAADFDYVRRANADQIFGLKKRDDLFRKGEELLSKYKVARVEQLPQRVLEKYSCTWAEALKSSASKKTATAA